MTVCLIPVKYGKRNYPPGIVPRVQEVAGHFGVRGIKPEMAYSLHTEYSFDRREFDGLLVEGLGVLCAAQRNGVPQLWHSSAWAEEFLVFLHRLTQGWPEPEVVEVHPPFRDYCGTLEEFLGIYRGFEERFMAAFPETKIFIENRCGSRYRGGRFLVSRVDEIVELCWAIRENGLKLRVVLDFPQLFTAYNLGPGKFTEDAMLRAMGPLMDVRDYIAGIHLWGKRKNAKGQAISHVGDLDSYFEEPEMKRVFLEALFRLLDDGVERYFVPEVNSGDEDLGRIVREIKQGHFI